MLLKRNSWALALWALTALGMSVGITHAASRESLARIGPEDYEPILKTTQGMNQRSPQAKECLSCEAMRNFQHDYSCPKEIFKTIKSFRSGGLFGTASNKVCSDQEPYQLNTPSKMEDYLATQTGLYFGVGKGKRIISNPECLATPPASHLNNYEKTQSVAAYYYAMNRLQAGELATIESIASIDALLGKKPFSDMDCNDTRMALTSAKCKKLKACGAAPGSFKDLVKESDEVAQVVDHFEKELGVLKRAKDPESQKKAQTLEGSIQGYYQMYPWLNGKEYQRYKKSGKSSSEAMKAQLQATRSALSHRFNQYRAAVRCMDSGGEDADCSGFLKTLGTTPDLPELKRDKKTGASAKQVLDVNLQFEKARCKMNFKQDTDELNKEMGLLAAGTALGLASMGAGSSLLLTGLVAGGAAINTAGAAAQAAMVCEEARNKLNGGSGQSVSSESCPKAYGGGHVQQSKECMKTALFNLGAAALPGVINGASKLAKWAPKLATRTPSKVTPKVGPKAAPKLRVKAEIHGGKAAADLTKQELKELAQEGKLTWKQRGELSDPQRIDASEAFLGRTLDSEEREGLLRIHHEIGKGKVFKQMATREQAAYSKADLRKKLEELEKVLKGDKEQVRAEARKLLREGMAGHSGSTEGLMDSLMFTNTEAQKASEEALKRVTGYSELKGEVEKLGGIKRVLAQPESDKLYSRDLRAMFDTQEKVLPKVAEQGGLRAVIGEWRESGKMANKLTQNSARMQFMLGNAEQAPVRMTELLRKVQRGGFDDVEVAQFAHRAINEMPKEAQQGALAKASELLGAKVEKALEKASSLTSSEKDYWLTEAYLDARTQLNIREQLWKEGYIAKNGKLSGEWEEALDEALSGPRKRLNELKKQAGY